MSVAAVHSARREALTIVGWQLLITVVAALTAWLAAGATAGWSALVGGLINVVASFYMAQRIFAAGPAATAQRWLARLWLGELLKFGITMALFALAIVVLQAAFLPLILAYMATFVAYWVGLSRISFGQAA